MADKSPPLMEELKKKEKVSGRVVKTTLAGAVVDIGLDKPGVVPISQLRKDPVRRVEEVVKEGDQVDAWVRRVDTEKGRVELTLIEPLAVEWRELKKGMTLKGTVSKLESFGAFVELGTERPGLVHVSEMSHDYVKRPEDVVKVGEEIEVQILAVDRRKKQIKLSMKALKAEAAAEENPEEEVDNTPPPTAMEMALRKAMDKDEPSVKIDSGERSRSKKSGEDMDAILSRTLEHRVKSK